jgi:hypothetical protein
MSIRASSQQYCQIISEGEVGAIITWDDTRIDGFDDIYAQRIDAVGTISWGSGFSICTAADRQSSPVITTDYLGGAVIAWTDESRPAGRYEITWDGRDGGGNAAASGVYFYTLHAGPFTETRKMVLLR